MTQYISSRATRRKWVCAMSPAEGDKDGGPDSTVVSGAVRRVVAQVGGQPVRIPPARPSLRCGFRLSVHNRRYSLGFRDRIAVFTHTFDMELDGLSDFFQQFLSGARRSHAARQVWHIGSVVVGGSFQLRQCISWVGLLHQARLFEDAVPCAW